MKQVTMESVKQRISELTTTGIVSLREDFELTCLRELVAVTENVRAVTEQSDALTVENVGLKTFISQSCYSYDGDGSDVCDSYIDAESSPFFPETPATDAAIAALRAEGVEMLAKAYETTAKDSNDFKFVNHCNIKAEQARDFARQLRDSKGESKL